MKLLCEVNEKVSFLTEGEGASKRLYLEGIFLMGVKPNGNGRTYPMGILEREASTYQKKISENRAYGELNHPQGPVINLDRVAIHIKELRNEGTDFVGKALVASTPMGQIVKNLHEDGANLGVSSRGVGSLKTLKDGLVEVQTDYKMITPADVVADPSAHVAFVRGIMENVDYWYDITKVTD